MTVRGVLAGVALVFAAMFVVTLQRPEVASRQTWKERHR